MDRLQLIELAAALVRPRKLGDFTSGDVGCAMVSRQGNLYTGVCIDTMSSMGFCAEHAAAAAMVTAGEYQVAQVVAVWKDRCAVYVLSPCGRCREFLRQLHPDNMDAEVVLGADESSALRDLLPKADWCKLVSLPPSEPTA